MDHVVARLQLQRVDHVLTPALRELRGRLMLTTARPKNSASLTSSSFASSLSKPGPCGSRGQVYDPGLELFWQQIDHARSQARVGEHVAGALDEADALSGHDDVPVVLQPGLQRFDRRGPGVDSRGRAR